MSQSLPTAEEGTVLMEARAEAVVFPGARALQEARPCSAGPESQLGAHGRTGT